MQDTSRLLEARYIQHDLKALNTLAQEQKNKMIKEISILIQQHLTPNKDNKYP